MGETKVRIPYNYEPRPYQINILKALDAGCKNACWVVHRRGGKDTTMWNYMIRRAFEEPGTYYYFLPTFTQAKRVIWDGMTNDGRKMLSYIPPEIVIGNPNNTEMKIWIKGMKGESLIQLIGADSFDSIMGTNPRGVVFSEWSLMDPRSYDFIKPILAANGGWCVFIFCVKEGTIIQTKEGLRRIEGVVSDSVEGFTDIDEEVYGLGGFHKAESFYNGGVKKLVKITTKRGYEISCTPNHCLWDGWLWKRSDEYTVGDVIPIQAGAGCWGNGLDISKWNRPEKRRSKNDVKVVSLDLFYLFGLILADGSWSENGGITVTTADGETQDFLRGLGFTGQDEVHYTYGSQELVSLMEWFGLIRGAHNKVIPERLYECSKEETIAFLQGYFDGDGCASKKGGVDCWSVSSELIRELQVVLLNFGIFSTRSSEIVKPTKKAKCWSTVYKLSMYGYHAYLFFKSIGFRLTRKQSRFIDRCKRKDVVPLGKEFLEDYAIGLNAAWIKRQRGLTYDKIESLVKKKPDEKLEAILMDGFYWDKVKSVEEDEGRVYDFVIPETHSFFSNGLVSHNTPRGRNHGWDLAEIAKDNPDQWFFESLTIRETGVLTEEQIEIERKKGMPEDIIQQEFYNNFNRGQEGSYYGAQMEILQKKGQICNVPFDPAVKVSTFWDLGIGDSTAIWWAQHVGQEIHLIHHYENSGEGLAHYARIISEYQKETGCIYDRHVAPHDIKARELSTGTSRLDAARRLGLRFTVAPKTLLETGIELTRAILHRCWFDKEKCALGVKCLLNYRKHYNEKLQVYSDRPFHDYTSHSADAFRMLAIMESYKNEENSIGDSEYDRMRKRWGWRR